jgi:hypothetical protein
VSSRLESSEDECLVWSMQVKSDLLDAVRLVLQLLDSKNVRAVRGEKYFDARRKKNRKLRKTVQGGVS